MSHISSETIYQLTEQRRLGKLQNDRVWDAAITPDNQFLITASENGQITLWDINSGKQLTSDQPGGKKHWLTLRQDKLFVKSQSDIYVYTYAEGKLELLQTLGHEGGDSSDPLAAYWRKKAAEQAGGTADEPEGSWYAHDIGMLPDGRILAAQVHYIKRLTPGNKARVTILQSGEVLFEWDYDNGKHPALRFSPTAETLYAASGTRIDRYNTATWQQQDPLHPDSRGDIRGIIVSPDGSVIASLSRPLTREKTTTKVGLTNATTGEPLCSPFSAGIGAAPYFNADASLVAIPNTEPGAGFDIYEVQTGKVLHSMEGGRPVCFSSDGRFMLCGSRSYEPEDLRLLVAGASPAPTMQGKVGSQAITASSRQKVRLIAELPGHSVTVRTVAVNRDGTLIASGGDDRTIRVWDVASGETRAVLRGHENSVVGLGFVDKFLVSASKDNTIRLWNLETEQVGRTIEVPEGDIRALANVRSRVGVVTSRGRAYVYQIETGEQVMSAIYNAPANDIAFSVDGALMAVATGGETRPGVEHDDDAIYVYQPPSSAPVKVIKADDWMIKTEFVGKILVGGKTRMALTAWNTPGKGRLDAWAKAGTLSDVSTVTGNPADSSMMIIGHRDSSIRLLDMSFSGEGHTLEGHTRGILALAMSEDGRILASAGEDNVVRIWGVSEAANSSGGLLSRLVSRFSG